MKAYAKYEFLQVSGGSASSTEKDREYASLRNSSTTTEFMVGAIPDRFTYEMKKSFTPGVLDVHIEPICNIIPVPQWFPGMTFQQRRRKTRSSLFRSRCMEFVNSLDFCVNASPLIERDVTQMEISNTFQRIRHHCGQAAEKNSIPFFGFEFDPDAGTLHAAVLTTLQTDSFGHCFKHCSSLGENLCRAFLFNQQNQACTICSENCFHVKMCQRRSSQQCSGAYIGFQVSPSFHRPEFLLLPQNVEVKGDIINSEVVTEVLTVDEWCMTYYFALAVLGGETRLTRTPQGGTDVLTAFESISERMIGPNAAFQCTKICSRFSSTEYQIRFHLAKPRYPDTSRFESNGHEKFVGKCLDYHHRQSQPHATFTLEYVCDCFAFGTVRSLIADNSQICSKLEVPGHNDLDVCKDLKFKAFTSHLFKY